jgi:hypothetical protein
MKKTKGKYYDGDEENEEEDDGDIRENEDDEGDD